MIIKRIGILISMFIIAFIPVMADSKDDARRYGLSLFPLTGIFYGQSEEIVYKYSSGRQYYSQLLWDLKPLVYTGLGINFGPRDPYKNIGIITEASLKYGLPFKTGIMEDRDWMDKDYDFLTHYSRHDAFARNVILADLSVGFSFHIKNFLSIGTTWQFSYMYLSWTAENGYTEYSLETPSGSSSFDPGNITTYYINGPGIMYTQNWFTFSPAVFIRGRFNRFISAEGSVSYSPLILFFGRDDHLLVDAYRHGKIFWDYCFFGHYVNIGTKFIFSPNKKFDLGLSVSYKYITGPRGKSYTETTGVYGSADDLKNLVSESTKDSGAGLSLLEAGIIAKFSLF